MNISFIQKYLSESFSQVQTPKIQTKSDGSRSFIFEAFHHKYTGREISFVLIVNFDKLTIKLICKHNEKKMKQDLQFDLDEFSFHSYLIKIVNHLETIYSWGFGPIDEKYFDYLSVFKIDFITKELKRLESFRSPDSKPAIVADLQMHGRLIFAPKDSKVVAFYIPTTDEFRLKFPDYTISRPADARMILYFIGWIVHSTDETFEEWCTLNKVFGVESSQ